MAFVGHKVCHNWIIVQHKPHVALSATKDEILWMKNSGQFYGCSLFPLDFSSNFIHKTNHTSWIFSHWTWMRKWIYEWIIFCVRNIIMHKWYFFKNLFHLKISQNFITRVMKEGSSIHQSEFMNEIACMFIHGIYMKSHGQKKLWMYFHGWNKTLGNNSWMKPMSFWNNMKFHLIISFFHNEFHLVGSVCINKRIHIIAFGHNAHM
jgi:hypothetical protein